MSIDARPVPAQAVRDSLGVVAIIPAQYIPAPKFMVHAHHREGAAARQAGKTLAGGAAGTVIMAAALAPVFPASIAVLVGAVTTAGMTVSEAANTSSGVVSTGMAEECQAAVNKAVASLDTQNAFAARLASKVKTDASISLATISAAGPDTPATHSDYAPLRASSIDTVLETAITEIGFSGCISTGKECRPPHLLHLFMRAQARLVRTADGETLFDSQFQYMSGQLELTKWLADDGRLLAEEFENAFRDLAEQVYDELFLVVPVELPVSWGDCWLEEVYPACSLGNCYKIDTLRPTLQWSAFPREIDNRKLDPAFLQKIGGVTYDLRIWDEERGLRNAFFTERWRGRLFYEREGLEVPQHTLELPLAPDSRYYWSVRARFVVDGRPMASRWARRGGPGRCYSDEINFDTNFHFDTPK